MHLTFKASSFLFLPHSSAVNLLLPVHYSLCLGLCTNRDMASTSSPTFSLSKFDRPLLYPKTKTKKNSSVTPFIRTLLRKQVFVSDTISILCLSKSNEAVFNSLLNECSADDTAKEISSQVQVKTCLWNWKGYSIRYQYSGNCGPALVLIHGFGANSDHWRKNISVLAHSHRVFSIDLIGYGYSEKPNPCEVGINNFYTFETWATQLKDFCIDVVKDKAFFICNSIGGVVGLQAAVLEPQICKGIVLLNISLRMLHIKKQPWYGRPLIRSFQDLLRNTALGKFFYRIIATPESVRNILCQCYHDTSQVTDELVQTILLPGLEPGASDVFLEFICYSGGPLPEELLPQVKCPVLIAWGDKDPWERIELGRAYENFDSVEDFIVLPDVGHCPQDEAPHLVNPLIESFVARHATPKISFSEKAS